MATRWLTNTEQSTWRAYLLGAARIEERLDAALRPHGVDLPEYEIFVALSESPDRRMRMSDLAENVHQSRSRLTHTISRMEASGYVQRSRSSEDGRGVVATLTDEGYDLLVRIAPIHVESVRAIFVDAVGEADYAAIGRAMKAVLAVQKPLD